jgi:hypothetical protein
VEVLYRPFGLPILNAWPGGGVDGLRGSELFISSPGEMFSLSSMLPDLALVSDIYY